MIRIARFFSTKSESHAVFQGNLNEAAVTALVYLSRLPRPALANSIDTFRSALFPIDLRPQISTRLAKVLAVESPQTPIHRVSGAPLTTEMKTLYERLEHHKELIGKAQALDLTPQGLNEAMQVVTEFCDKGRLGFLSGDLSVELFELLMSHLSYFETKKTEENSDIYKKLEEYLTAQEFSLPKHGIVQGDMENPQALFIRELRVEKDSAEISLAKDKSESGLLMHSAFGLNYLTPKEQLTKIFLPFCRLIRGEQELCLRKDLSKSRQRYASMFIKCPADRLALMSLTSIMRLCLPHVRDVNESIELNFSTVVENIGQNIQKQIKEDKQDQLFAEFKKQRKEKKLFQITDEKYMRKLLANKLKDVSSKCAFTPEERAEVGATAFRLLVQAIPVPENSKPLLIHEMHKGSHTQKSRGVIRVSREFARLLMGKYYDQKQHMLRFYMERILPMICKPARWTDCETGGYLQPGFNIMRMQGSRLQRSALERADISPICKVLNIMGDTAWRINHRVHEVAEKLYEQGGGVGEIPIVDDGHKFIPPESSTYLDKKKLEKLKRDNWSLLCDFEIKLGIARAFEKVDKFYMPLNLDFRGRIYPISPHLNQIGNDISRGFLEFAEGKPLGPTGLQWLKIHLANKMGHDKLPIEERLKVVEDSMPMIKDIAVDPLKNREWLALEDSWQSLASMIELMNALNSPDPEKFISHLHIHQDGSCNGLQHYAALGRDMEGAEQVNLSDGVRPGDIYTAVSKKVQERVNQDAAAGHKIASQLVGKIKRKIVKQTVMTSVYGVTYIGAKDQIKRQLKDKELLTDDELNVGGQYLAAITMSTIADLFAGAHRIKGWLIDCAGSIAKAGYPVSWVTPLGLPVVQPYRRGTSTMFIDTFFQRVSLLSSKDHLPISVPKQKSAFPPNYVHSLDSTHLMLTAMECYEHGITFAAVHDSFWTHACNVDEMNTLLRQKFVYLHSQPLLDNLLEDFKARHPSIHFDPVPDRGEFDLTKVLNSTYFFA